jgi:hypothetical protein
MIMLPSPAADWFGALVTVDNSPGVWKVIGELHVPANGVLLAAHDDVAAAFLAASPAAPHAAAVTGQLTRAA